MRHILVVPTDLIEKLNDARADDECHSRWTDIGVESAEDMMNLIVRKMNEEFVKLSIISYEVKDKAEIKEDVANNGSASKYLGYLKTENEDIDGLFFYNEPKTSTGNDLMTRNIWPSLIGIYKGIKDNMVDLHFNSRPVYIVNINETSRMQNKGVKINIICAMLSGFNYTDVFNNSVMDVAPVDYALPDGTVIEITGKPKDVFRTVQQFDELISDNNNNDYFEYDDEEKTVTILPNRFNSSNPSAELYRFCSKIIPVAYIAKENNYQIDVEPLDTVNIGNLDVLKEYLRRFNNL